MSWPRASGPWWRGGCRSTHLRPREGDARRHRRGRMGGAGRHGRVRTDPARARRHRPRHGRGGRRLRGAGTRPRPRAAGRDLPGGSGRAGGGRGRGPGHGGRALRRLRTGRPCSWSTWRRWTRCSCSTRASAADAAPGWHGCSLPSRSGARRVDDAARPVDAAVALSTRRCPASRWRAMTARSGGTARCSRPPCRWAMPRRPWTSPSPTPRNVSSSARPSAASRPSSTCAPTCSCAPRSLAPRCTPRPAWPMRPTSSTPRRRSPAGPPPGGGPFHRRRQAAGRRGRDRKRPIGHSGPRGHGLHVGGAAAPAPQAAARALDHLRHPWRTADPPGRLRPNDAHPSPRSEPSP